MKISLKYILVALVSSIVTVFVCFYLNNKPTKGKAVYSNADIELTGGNGEYRMTSSDLKWTITVSRNSNSIFIDTIVTDVFGSSIKITDENSKSSHNVAGFFVNFEKNITTKLNSKGMWIRTSNAQP